MKQFLIIQTAFLGDVILATPLIEEYHRIYPSASIDVLVRKGNEGILKDHPLIRNIFTFDKTQKKTLELTRLIKHFKTLKYDEIINLHRYLSSGLITLFAGAISTVGFDKNPVSFFYTRKIKHSIDHGLHEVERNLSCIAHHGAAKITPPKLYPNNSDSKKIEHLAKGNYYCIAPASVWFTKQLPTEKWIELIGLLPNNESIYLLGGPADAQLCEDIKLHSTNPNVFNLAGTLSYLESAALMKNAQRNFVNDSGPLHISSSMDAKVTAFFCSTTPNFGFGPLSSDAIVVESKEKLSCKPCGIHGHRACPKGHFNCGKTIDLNKLSILPINLKK
jgi:ADP-heptose:LPS heptosyltransferase